VSSGFRKLATRISWADFNGTKDGQQRQVSLYTENFDTKKYTQQQLKYTNFRNRTVNALRLTVI